MALSDSAILEQYKLARDAIVMAIAQGRDVVEYWVMNQRRRSADPVKELAIIEQQIAYYDNKVATSTSGSATTYATITH